MTTMPFGIVTLLLLSVVGIEAERKDGDLLIGAVIPIRRTENGSCGGLNYEGIAVSEAIRFAIEEINKDNKLLGELTIDRKLGYDIQDTCGSIEVEKDIAYLFNGDRRNYKSKSPGGRKPVSAVIGEFKKASVESMKLLNFESIAQVSYAPQNARLMPDGMEAEDLIGLLSVHPEDVTKMKAVAATLNKLKIEYTTLISSDDVRGKDGEKLLKDRLDSLNMCLSDKNLAKSEDDVKDLVRKLKRKSEAKMVVLHCDEEDAFTAMVEAARLNMTDIVWMSTVSMKDRRDKLSPIAEQANGLIYIELHDPISQGFKSFVENKGGNFYNESEWIKKAMIEEGGMEKCLAKGEALTKTEQEKCDVAMDKVVKNVMNQSTQAAYAIDAVYAIASGLQAMLVKTTPSSLFDSISELDFQSPLTQSKIHFNSDGQAIAQSFSLRNIEANSTYKDKEVGTWKRDNEPSLDLSMEKLRFKKGEKMAPVSKCSKDCVPSKEIVYPERGPKCCWACEKCPNATISNETNSKCFKCNDHQTANRQQTACYDFKKLHLKAKNPVSEFTFFLLTICLLFTLFTMFIFNQNKDCEVMQMADNATMQALLLGIIIVLTSSVVLMFMPTFSVCITYAAMFNVGLTIIISSLLTKTWLFRCLFYGSNETSTACGSRPGLLFGFFLVLIQGAIIGGGVYLENWTVLYEETEQWNVRYVECSSFRGIIFWVSYGFNILLSVLLNFFNCGAPNVEARFGEYNWLCVTACSYYAISFTYIASLWAFPLLQKIEAATVLTVLHCVVFLLAYCYPKLHMVLFMNSEQMKEVAKSERANLIYRHDDDDDETAHSPTSGIDVFKNRIVQLNMETDEDKHDSK